MRSHGYSLLELLTALVVVATLALIAVPSLSWLVLDSRRTADINALISAIQLARSEAAKRGALLTLCPSLDGRGCAADGTSFTHGWIVRVEAQAPPAGAVLVHHTPRNAGTIEANRNRFVFRPNFRRGTNGSFTFCDARGAAAARAVIVSYTGRPRVAASGPGGRPLLCPV